MRLFLSLVLLAQFVMIPFFMDLDKASKALFVAIVCLVYLLTKNRIEIDLKVAVTFALFILPFLFTVDTLNSFALLLFLFALFLLLGFVQNFSEDGFVFYLKVYSVFSVILSILGIYEYNSAVLLGNSNEMLIPYVLPPVRSLRVAGIYGQPNLFSLALVVGLFSLFYLYIHENEKTEGVFLYLRFLPIFLVGLAFSLTDSRSGLVAFLIPYFTMAWLFVKKRYLPDDSAQRKKFMLASFSVAMAFFVFYLLGQLDAGGEVRSFTDSGLSVDARFVFWLAAFFIFYDNSLLGCGLNSYKDLLPEYVNKAHDFLGFVGYEAMGYTKWAHNELLQLAAEGGSLVLVILIVLLALFVWSFIRKFFSGESFSGRQLYLYLFLMPFLIQSMFSWTLRHPALLILFVTFLAFFLGQFRGNFIVLSGRALWLPKAIATLGLLLVVWIGYQQVQLGDFVRHFRDQEVEDSFVEFKRLNVNSYVEMPLLLNATPFYVYEAMRSKDIAFAESILPYVKRLVDLQGAHWQWYNLSVVYQLLGRKDEASVAVENAIERWPVEGRYWAFQHYLNMLDASERSGRPLDEFLPIPPGGDVGSLDGLKEVFDFDDRIKINM